MEKVIDSKKIKGKLHYLIRWKGYSADSDTWEPENTLSCQELINKFIDEVSETIVHNMYNALGTNKGVTGKFQIWRLKIFLGLTKLIVNFF